MTSRILTGPAALLLGAGLMLGGVAPTTVAAATFVPVSPIPCSRSIGWPSPVMHPDIIVVAPRCIAPRPAPIVRPGPRLGRILR